MLAYGFPGLQSAYLQGANPMRRTFCALAGFGLLSIATASVAQVAQPPALPPGAPPQPRPMPGMTAPPRDNPQEKTGSAVLSGRVVATDTGKPLRRALVRASSQETPQGRTVSTDGDGRWQLKEFSRRKLSRDVSARAGMSTSRTARRARSKRARSWSSPTARPSRRLTSACRGPASSPAASSTSSESR